MPSEDLRQADDAISPTPVTFYKAELSTRNVHIERDDLPTRYPASPLAYGNDFLSQPPLNTICAPVNFDRFMAFPT